MLVKYEPWNIEDTTWGIEIVEGEFKGTKISINDISMPKENGDEMLLDFNFIKIPEGKTDQDMNSDKFNITINFILNDILTKAIDEFQNRNRNTSKSD